MSRKIVFLIVWFVFLPIATWHLSCGGGGSNSPSLSEGTPCGSQGCGGEEEASRLESLWGVDDSVESKFVYLRDKDERGKVQVEKVGNELIIKDNLDKMSAQLASDGQSYSINLGNEKLSVQCTIPSSVSERVDMSCIINGTACQYSMEFKGDGYEETEDSCKNVLKEAIMAFAPNKASNIKASVSKEAATSYASQSEENLDHWANTCGHYSGSDPEVCPNVVDIEGIKYYYRTSCVGRAAPIKSEPNGISADEPPEPPSNQLRILRVYAEDEKEGCFLFVCNGPHGNIHFMIMPYNRGLLDGNDFDIARNIREAEDSAPIYYHLKTLPGAYKKDDQCEWYETDDVGYQDVYYDDMVVWDWDKFCMGDKCPYKLMFTIYESDEEKKWYVELVNAIFCSDKTKICIKDDYIGYGILRHQITLNYDKTFYMPQFKIAFRTIGDKPLPEPNFENEEKEFEFIIIAPFGLEFGKDIQGIKKLFPDPWDANVVWISAFAHYTPQFPGYILLKWNHRGTPFDPSDDVIEDYSYNITGDTSELDARVQDIAGDVSNGLWFASNDYGVFHLDNLGNWVSSYKKAGPLSIDIGSNGRVYVGANGFVSVFDGNDWFTLVDGGVGMAGLAIDSENRLWFDSNGNEGLYHVDLDGNLDRKDFFWEEGLNEGRVTSMLIESQDRFWLGTGHSGLYMWDVSSDTTKGMGKMFGTSYFPPIDDMHMDPKGRLWIANGNGVAYLDKELTPHNFGWFEPNGSMQTIMEDSRKRLWFGSHRGLYLLVEKPK